MDISELTLRVLILFFPGVVCALLTDSLTVHRPRTTPMFIVNAFVLGIACYLLLYIVVAVVNVSCSLAGVPFQVNVLFFDALVGDDKQLNWLEIFIATLLSIPLGFALSGILNKKWINRIAQQLGVTNRFGDLDVWDYMLNTPELVWVTVRDNKNDLAYMGWVRAFSDTVDNPELLLMDVDVYSNSTGEKLYRVEGLYLARKREEITVELAQFGYSEVGGEAKNRNSGRTNG